MKLTITAMAIYRVELPLKLMISVGLVFVFSQVGLAQTWSVNNPEVYQSVPQYPLNRSTGRKPAAIQLIPSLPGFESPTIEPTANPPAEAKPDRSIAVYREWNLLPIDTRTPENPCDSCTRPSATQPRFCCDAPGLEGRPYVDKVSGGCLCGKKKTPKHPEFSIYWPRPFSANLDERFSEKAAARYVPCQKKRLVDMFDSLSTLKLSGYQRTDNGYCGRGSDPYGCLGESKRASRVAGIGYRMPGDPVAPGNRYSLSSQPNDQLAR